MEQWIQYAVCSSHELDSWPVLSPLRRGESLSLHCYFVDQVSMVDLVRGYTEVSIHVFSVGFVKVY